MDQRSWLVRRALLALGLMVGFYVLAIGIALALLWVPYAQYVYTHRIYGRVVVFCLGAAGALLWAILPRIDRFEPPGPPLFRENNHAEEMAWERGDDVSRGGACAGSRARPPGPSGAGANVATREPTLENRS